MHTEDDLRAACTALADRAPSPDDVRIVIPRSAERVRPVRRPQVLAGVAVATAATAVAVPTLLPIADREPADPVSRPADRLELPFALTPPAGWTVTGEQLASRDAATVSVSKSTDIFCGATAYRPGRFDTSRIAVNRTPVTVQKRPGFFAVVRYEHPKKGTAAPQGAPAVVWEYATGAWAVVSCQNLGTGTAATEYRLANAMTFAPQPLLVPITMKRPPAGFRTTSVETGRAAELHAFVELTRGTQRTMIMIGAGGGTGAPTGLKITKVSVNGNLAWFFDEKTSPTESLHVTYPGGYYVELQLPKSVPDARAELLSTAHGVQLAADPADRGTWFDAAVALPR